MGSSWQAVANAFTGRYQPSGDWTEADCLVGHCFGLVSSARQGDPGFEKLGLANAALGEYIYEGFRHLPKILEVEVQVAYSRFDPSDIWNVAVISGSRRPDTRYDTHEVNAQAAEIIKRHGWKKALVVAHAHHIVRAEATLAKMGVQTIVPDALPNVWDPQAEQAEVRSTLRFGLVTMAAVGIYKLHGWI